MSNDNNYINDNMFPSKIINYFKNNEISATALMTIDNFSNSGCIDYSLMTGHEIILFESYMKYLEGSSPFLFQTMSLKLLCGKENSKSVKDLEGVNDYLYQILNEFHDRGHEIKNELEGDIDKYDSIDDFLKDMDPYAYGLLNDVTGDEPIEDEISIEENEEILKAILSQFIKDEELVEDLLGITELVKSSSGLMAFKIELSGDNNSRENKIAERFNKYIKDNNLEDSISKIEINKRDDEDED